MGVTTPRASLDATYATVSLGTSAIALPAGVGPVGDISCSTATSCYALASAPSAAGGTAGPLTSVLLAYGS